MQKQLNIFYVIQTQKRLNRFVIKETVGLGNDTYEMVAVIGKHVIRRAMMLVSVIKLIEMSIEP